MSCISQDYPTPDQRLAAFATACGGAVKEVGAETLCNCPAHDDTNPSLNVRLADNGNLLVKCRANCSNTAIVEAIGWTMRDLMRAGTNQTGTKKKPAKAKKSYPSIEDIVHAAARWKNGAAESCHTYQDGSGRDVFGVIRVRKPDGTKEVPQFRREGDAWVFGGIGKNRPLYNLPAIQELQAGAAIAFFEGEQKADLSSQLGLVATSTSQGAGNGKLSDFSPLCDLRVLIFPDNDEAGIKHMNDVAARGYKAGAASVAHVKLPDLPKKGDVVDFHRLHSESGVDDAGILAKIYAAIENATEIDRVIEPSQPDVDQDRPVPLGEPDPETGRVILSPNRTPPTAYAFLRDNYTTDGTTTLVSYGQGLWSWRGNRYELVEDASVENELFPWLHDALRYYVDKQTKELRTTDFESNPGTVKAALSTIKAQAYLPANVSIPFWRSNGQPPAPLHELLACKSMTLHIPSGRIIAPTPELFTVNALDFNYSPHAASPTKWLEFLKALFGDDTESVELLQEWFGYNLTADTSQQKILLIVGPRRSGKGTIARVLTNLVGKGNVVGPTVSSLAGNFGLQQLLGKSVAIVSDARFAGDSITTVTERLLCISGEDSISVDRKFLDQVNLKLPCRFTFLTNELPHLSDASNALAGRFILLRLQESFYGKEDTQLTEELLAELPSILIWALKGWHRLNKRGKFVVPASSRDAIRDLEDLSSPINTFIRENCVIAPGLRIHCRDLLNAWRSWCMREGRMDETSPQVFGRNLAAAAPSISRRRGTSQSPFYDGIGLKTSEAT